MSTRRCMKTAAAALAAVAAVAATTTTATAARCQQFIQRSFIQLHKVRQP